MITFRSNKKPEGLSLMKVITSIVVGVFCLATLPASIRLVGQEAAAPRLYNPARTNAAVALDWTQLGAGVAYTVQSRDFVGDGLWTSVRSGQPWPIASNRWVDARPLGDIARFYRLLAVPAADRGKLISTNAGRALSVSELTFAFLLQGVPVTPQYGVQLQKVVYETVGPLGARIQASGLLVLPQNVGKALPLMSYQHGTLARKSDAPSSMDLQNLEVFVGIAFASGGYAAVLPDYLGMGDSPGIHPYHHASSEATACVDMLRAARAVCSSQGVTLTAQLFLCGYSQGGHATMAFHRELEAFHTNEFAITASAPMAGAYDLSSVTATDFLSGRHTPNPYYFALLLAAYQDVYHIADSLPAMLVPPYQTTLPPLLTGATTGSAINAAMPNPAADIVKPEILAAFRTNYNHPLRVALRDNDLYQWRPIAPMRLYHCGGDQDVGFANSIVATNSFAELGATNVTLVEPSATFDHGDCVLPSLLQAKAWFDSLKK